MQHGHRGGSPPKPRNAGSCSNSRAADQALCDPPTTTAERVSRTASTRCGGGPSRSSMSAEAWQSLCLCSASVSPREQAELLQRRAFTASHRDDRTVGSDAERSRRVVDGSSGYTDAATREQADAPHRGVQRNARRGVRLQNLMQRRTKAFEVGRHVPELRVPTALAEQLLRRRIGRERPGAEGAPRDPRARERS